VRAARLLEWPRLRARLEDLASCEPGRALARALEPSRDKAAVRRALRETSEARFFLRGGKALPFGAITDVRSALQRARIGSTLDARDLNRVKRVLDATRRVRQVLAEAPDDEFRAASWDSEEERGELYDAILKSKAELIEPQPGLEAAIDSAIDEATEEIKDSASLELRRARANIGQAAAAIQSRLRAMLADSAIQPALQDAFVTVRDGRYCLPVKSEARGRVPGIVHDRSSGGGTVFVEPQAVIDLNNQLREWQAAEKEAIEAILKSLSAQVGAVADAVENALDIGAELDFAFAKGRLSLAQDAAPACVAEAPKYLLVQARHPLVENCVPNDIALGGDAFDVLMITGPNTGGKTVVMKTLGLLVWATMCGLHIPARAGSEVFLPRAIWADIGDEQSIEQSLSTFSSHMTNIIAILEDARAEDLAFFDEIGAGTDPDEGAALAKAILRALQRRGVQILCTTHYGELKHFSASAERFENASVEFDAASLRPTYRLRIGVPGSSNALDITARLGMSQELVARARKYLGRDRVEAEAATVRLEEAQRELESRTGDIEREKREAEKLRREYEKRLARLEAEAEKERAAARQAANEIIARAEKKRAKRCASCGKPHAAGARAARPKPRAAGCARCATV
jgi:DNA mismatch repair protein MutS2